MAEKKKSLVLDCGTQSMRAHIVDSEGNLLAMTKAKYPPYTSDGPGWIEWDVEMFWESAITVFQEMKNAHPGIFTEIEAVTVSSQRASTVFVDDEGKPLRKLISWMDTRLADNPRPIKPLVRILFGLTGMTDLTTKFNRLCHTHWLMENESEVWAQTHKVLLLSVYLNYRLTGNFSDSVSAAVGYIPIDVKNFAWAEQGSMTRELFQIERDKLFDLVTPGDILGTISENVAAETGLKAGLPVIASGSDKACETLGVGCLDETSGSVSLGSLCTIEIASSRYFGLSQVNQPYPAAIPGMYNLEISIMRGFWLVSWFEKEFGHREELEAKELNIPTIELMNQRIENIPPGSMGLTLQPYWGSDTRFPDARGAIIGFGDQHTRYHMYRALIEGLGYSLLEGIQLIEKKSGKVIEEIALSGGGSQSDVICQILADIFNRPLYRVQSHETSGIGGAIAAFVGIGVYDSFEDGVENMVHRTSEFLPNPEAAAKYKEIYSTVYQKMYKQLKPLYKGLSELKL